MAEQSRNKRRQSQNIQDLTDQKPQWYEHIMAPYADMWRILQNPSQWFAPAMGYEGRGTAWPIATDEDFVPPQRPGWPSMMTPVVNYAERHGFGRK